MASDSGPAARKMKRKLRYTCRPRKRPRKSPEQLRNRSAVDEDTIFDRTGVFELAFLEYYDRLAPLISAPRVTAARAQQRRRTATSLDGMSRLQLVLEYLRHNQSYKMLAISYSISVAQVSREIRHLLPIILASLDDIPSTLPNNLIGHDFENVVGAIDCTCHYHITSRYLSEFPLRPALLV